MPKLGKGERPHGRQKGSLNKKTIAFLRKERIAEQAQTEVDAAARSRKKLGKDILEDYTLAFHAVAAVYQRKVVIELQAGREPNKADLASFEKWGTLVVTTAKNLADFQSPKFRAHAFVAPPPSSPKSPLLELKANDAVSAARAYSEIVRRFGGAGG